MDIRMVFKFSATKFATTLCNKMLLMLYLLMFCIASKASKKIQKYNGSEFLRDKLSLYWEITQHFVFCWSAARRAFAF